MNLHLSGAKGNKKTPETFIMHKYGQNNESSNSEKGNIKLLTDERSQILYSNYSEENYCGSLKEEKIDSKFMTELGETETKIIIKSVALYISSKDSNEKTSPRVLGSCDELK